jgi:hypothetical protein
MDTSTHSPHRRAWDTLPWLVAGSASAEDAAQALHHLSECEECRAELAFHQRLHAGLQAQGPRAEELPDPGAGFQRLAARLDAASGADAAAPTPAPASATPWTRWLVAAVMVQAVGLGAAGLVLFEHSHGGDFRTLSQAGVAARPATLRVVPAPGMDFAALRALLASTRMELVEAGPDGGSLGLAPQDGQPATTAAALQVLRSSPQVVLAEPLP